jgi:hypothetical protein
MLMENTPESNVGYIDCFEMVRRVVCPISEVGQGVDHANRGRLCALVSLPSEWLFMWRRSLRDFEASHPGCHIEVKKIVFLDTVEE